MYLIDTNILKCSSILLIYCGYLKNKKPNTGQKTDRLKAKKKDWKTHTTWGWGQESKETRWAGGGGEGSSPSHLSLNTTQLVSSFSRRETEYQKD